VWEKRIIDNLTITRTCPQCGRVILLISEDEEIVLTPCDHYQWWLYLKTEPDKPKILRSIAELRLWKR